MKAAFFEKYGSPESVIEIKEVSKPTPGDNELLIRIHATTVNDYDWSLVRGKPGIYRLMFGLNKPKNKIPGMELAGVVEAVGKKVSSFKVGDAVFGDTSDVGFGTFAEYICLHEKAFIKKPEALSFEEAAAIPHASTLAIQALRDLGKIQYGQRILINGGGGGVGTIGLQFAKLYHCEVTGVDSGDKLGMMKSIGFDHIIDYKKEDFTKNGVQYDLILDCKTNRSARSFYKSLTPNGRYVTIGGELTHLIGVLISGKLRSLFTKKKLLVLGLKTNKDLSEISQLFAEKKISCQIDGPYSLEESPRLIQYFGEGKHRGKIVINPTNGA